MNLIADRWLPVIRRDGTCETIAIFELLNDYESNPVVDLESPRPDFYNAICQLLIGIVQVALAPKNEEKWAELWSEPYSPEDFEERILKYQECFDIDSEGPAFMQDHDLKVEEAKEEDLTNLFIDLPANDHYSPANRSVDQLKGIEGARVRKSYELMAKQYGVAWKGRRYDPNDWEAGDLANRAISAATSCLYGLTEAAILAAGYAPAIGFIHTGKPLSFVYDIADLFKAEMVLPLAFKLAARNPPNIDRAVRLGCRDTFREKELLKRIIPSIEEVLAAGEIGLPEAPPDAILPAIPTPEGIGDAGHRNK